MKTFITVSGLVFAVFALSGCNPSKTTTPVGGATASPTVSAEAVQASPATPSIAKISASPNPVPAGSGSRTTTIKWTTGDGSTGHVYASMDHNPEGLFSTGPDGSVDAPWIVEGHTYEFRLYDADHIKVLAKVVVTHAEQ